MHRMATLFFPIITNHNKDQSWKPENEADMLIRKVSALIWNYFEPQHKWKPAAGIEKYMNE